MITSPLFWAVLAAAAIACRLVPRGRDWILVLAFALYLGREDWLSVAFVVGFGMAAYAITQWRPALAKSGVPALIVVVLLYLAYFKYYPPIRDALAGTPAPSEAPKGGLVSAATAHGAMLLGSLGASYFVFKLIHYLVDSTRQQIPKHGPQTLLAYLLFLPMFFAGPIQRFDDYLKDRRPFATRKDLAEGGSRIVEGLIKKVVIVDLLLDSKVFSHDTRQLAGAIPFFRPPCTIEQLVKEAHTIHPFFTWQYVIHTFTQWYLDFSAYSDVAVGAALLFGIRLTENFDYPLVAPNPTEFWKRYHMSLSAFCQRYVYLPVLGWTRNPYVAVYATMMTMGLWHAGSLNYLAWGVYHGTILSIYLTWGRIKRWKKIKPKGLIVDGAGTIATALLACASAVFPATSAFGIGAGLRLFGTLFGIHT